MLEQVYLTPLMYARRPSPANGYVRRVAVYWEYMPKPTSKETTVEPIRLDDFTNYAFCQGSEYNTRDLSPALWLTKLT